MSHAGDEPNDEFEHLIYEKTGAVACITLNRPERLNALNLRLFAELRQALILAQLDPEVQVPIITGAGRAFCTGADLKEVSEHHASERARWEGAYESAEVADALFRQMTQMDKIVVCAVNGLAYAGGVVLAACSDIAIASDRAIFRVTEALVGISDQLSTTWLEASIGLARTKLMILTAQELTAAEAQSMGLIAAAVPHEELWPQTERIVNRVLQTAPRARAGYKHLLNDRLPKTEQRHIVQSHLSDECREGSEAFREKRAPRWLPQKKD